MTSFDLSTARHPQSLQRGVCPILIMIKFSSGISQPLTFFKKKNFISSIIYILSIGIIIQTQIFEDCGKDSPHPDFNVEIHLPYESGGHIDPVDIKPDVLYGETIDDPELKERILEGTVPLVDSIFRQLNSYLYLQLR